MTGKLIFEETKHRRKCKKGFKIIISIKGIFVHVGKSYKRMFKT